MSARNTKAAGSSMPILQGVLPLKGAQVPAEIIAGITLAALAIPEVMGYTKISGTPVITGLYTILIPMAPMCPVRFVPAPGRGCRFGHCRHTRGRAGGHRFG